MQLNIMTKYFQKTKKKLGQGIKSLTKFEKRKTDDLFSKDDTQRFLILHFGTGNESDFLGITDFLLNEIKMDNNHYSLGIIINLHFFCYYI
jgi:hypothetical protein